MKTIMRDRACQTRKYSIIFLFLAVVVLIFVLNNMDILEVPHTVIPTVIVPRVSTDPDMHHGFCNIPPLSPEDTVEEHRLLDSVAWPETPLLPDPFPLEQTSDPAHSTFTILPRRGGEQWHVGDQLEVMINIFDYQGRSKKSGGDLLFARLHNPELHAGVAGQVVDHLNGSYFAVFSLLWEGDAHVEVKLVHPSEAITVLKRLNIEQPDRMIFQSLFRSGSLSETTECNVCLRERQRPQCNFSDPRIGEPWFCYKPKNLSCDTRINHSRKGYKQDLKAGEEKLFQSDVNMKVYINLSGPASVTVLPEDKGQPEIKSDIVTSGVVGYYYQGVWQALDGTTVHQFDVPATIRCLSGKEVHMFGDSTIRQWFEYLTATLPDLKKFHIKMRGKYGPHLALDYVNNILVQFHFHGIPLQIPEVSPSELRYAANDIDDLIVGPHTVVVIGIWAHFANYPLELYIRRMQNIRRAVVRLLNRSPETKVIIRTGNPKRLNLYYALNMSDWFTVQSDKVLRAIFKGLNVCMIYAWEMAMAHHLPHNVHPQPPIIKNMMDAVLSYVCPRCVFLAT